MHAYLSEDKGTLTGWGRPETSLEFPMATSESQHEHPHCTFQAYLFPLDTIRTRSLFCLNAYLDYIPFMYVFVVYTFLYVLTHLHNF